jgi:hypothetical protein
MSERRWTLRYKPALDDGAFQLALPRELYDESGSAVLDAESLIAGVGADSPVRVRMKNGVDIEADLHAELGSWKCALRSRQDLERMSEVTHFHEWNRYLAAGQPALADKDEKLSLDLLFGIAWLNGWPGTK